MKLEVRFFKKVNRRGRFMPNMRTRYHEWTGAAGHLGYGRIWYNGKTVQATHVAWFLAYGVWPKQWMLHKCDNPACIRPSHLFDGTVSNNVQDMLHKGRQRYAPRFGEDSGRAKLSDALALEAVRRVRKGETQTEVALDLGISQGQLSRIFRGRRRKNLSLVA